MDMRFLMRQAQAMQQKLLDAQQALKVEGTSGGEMVKVVLNGAKELQSITISKEVMDPEDPSMLEDLIQAAFKDATQKAEDAMAQVSGGLTGGLNIPGLKL